MTRSKYLKKMIGLSGSSTVNNKRFQQILIIVSKLCGDTLVPIVKLSFQNSVLPGARSEISGPNF